MRHFKLPTVSLPGRDPCPAGSRCDLTPCAVAAGAESPQAASIGLGGWEDTCLLSRGPTVSEAAGCFTEVASAIEQKILQPENNVQIMLRARLGH